MEQRDFLTRQIEQMGKVLAKIIADILHLPDTVEPQESIAQSTKQLKMHLDIDLNQLSALSPSELNKYMRQRNFNPDLMENLAYYIQLIGKKQALFNSKEADLSFQTSLNILEAADAISETFSFKREEMKKELQVDLGFH